MQLKNSRRGKTGFRGVSTNGKTKNAYIAQIKVKGVKYHLGYFSDIVLAAKAYNEKAVKVYGTKAILNEVNL